MKRERIQNKVETVLSGLTIQSFKLVEGGTLILYLTHRLAPVSVVEKSTRLWIESAWRICASDRIVGGSLDSPDMLLPELRNLIGLDVKSVRLDGLPGDITVLLDSGVTIESFSRSVQDEQWQVRTSDGLRFGLRENLELYEAIEDPG